MKSEAWIRAELAILKKQSQHPRIKDAPVGSFEEMVKHAALGKIDILETILGEGKECSEYVNENFGHSTPSDIQEDLR